MSQIETTKLSTYVALGPPEGQVSVTKMSVYVLLVPGDDGSEPPSRQGYCYAQKVRRS